VRDQHRGREPFSGWAGIALLCWVLAAQAVEPAAGTQDESGSADTVVDGGTIVVTGSRIPRNAFETLPPTTSLDQEFLDRAVVTSVGEMLSQLPSLSSATVLQNQQAFVGTVGLNLLDLRGLGVDRTLVLVDGRRHVGAYPGSTAVDINTIPEEWIERIDVITGGASAIYGADAVTGVVNIILKKNIEGFHASYRYGGATDNGFNNRAARFSAGRNFDGGRGNAAISFEYAGQDRLRATERKFSRTNFTLLPNPDDVDGTDVGENDGIPDQILARNGGSFFLNDAGVFFDQDFNPYTFGADRSLRPVGLGDAPDFDNLVCAGPGCDFLDTARYDELQPRFERYVTQAKLRFELMPGHDLFLETKLAHSRAQSINQPSFDFIFAPVSDALPVFGIPVLRDNAFIRPDLAALMDTQGLDSISLSRFNDDLGLRLEDNDRDLFRSVVGAEGAVFDSDWTYNLSAVYGRSEQIRKGPNNRINARFYAATDAVLDPDSGQVACRATVDAAATFPGTDIAVPFDVAQGCIPINVLGAGTIDPAARNWINATATDRSTLTQSVLTAFVQNPDVWTLPAGGLGIASGLEYRRETSRFTPDALAATGATFESPGLETNGEFEVYEGFVEASIPLLASMPAVHALRLDMALRLADYDTIGSATTWKLGLDYAPTRTLRFRGTRSRAIRAPNIADLFQPQSANFFEVTDPCSADRLQNAPDAAVRAINCLALGLPEDFQSQADNATLQGVTGGNPDLQEEKSNSYTLGFAITPSFAPGFKASVDYWNIEIKDAISVVEGQDILDRCVDDPGGIGNGFCALSSRDPDSGEISNIVQTVQNLQKLEAAGVDFEAGYARNLLGGKVEVRAIATWLDKLRAFPFQQESFFDEQAGEVGSAEWQGNVELVFSIDKLVSAWTTRYIDRSLREDDQTVKANPDVNDAVRAGSRFYHDARVQYRLWPACDLYAGVENVFDKHPPRGNSAIGEGSAVYDNIGRFVYLGTSVRIGGTP
jgi:outer membrane receptor protein involved in Fe transport